MRVPFVFQFLLLVCILWPFSCLSSESVQEANFLLYQRVRQCADAAEYECLRQLWDTVNRPQYRQLEWSVKQAEVLALIRERLSYEDL